MKNKIKIKSLSGQDSELRAADLIHAPALLWDLYCKHKRPELEKVHAIICALLYGEVKTL